MKVSPETVKAWLAEISKDRHWLADQIGVSKRTLDNWFADSFPLYAEKSIERLRHELESSTPEIDDSVIQLSLSQWQELSRRAHDSGFDDEMEYVNSILRESLKSPTPPPKSSKKKGGKGE